MATSVFHRLAAIAVVILVPALARAESDKVNWRINFDAAKVEAAQTNRMLLVHFWTTTCGPCRVLDQSVFNQPHVGAALERDFVPVKVDADAAPALTNQFRITQVPTDVIINPQGEIVAKLNCPNVPDSYLGQLQTLARHFRQTTGPSGLAGPGSEPVNAAYANLPTTRKPAANGAAPDMGSTYVPFAGPPAQSRYGANAMTQAPLGAVQSNPYIAQAPARTQPNAAPSQLNAQPATSAAMPPAGAPAAAPAVGAPGNFQPQAASAIPPSTPMSAAQTAEQPKQSLPDQAPAEIAPAVSPTLPALAAVVPQAATAATSSSIPIASSSTAAGTTSQEPSLAAPNPHLAAAQPAPPAASVAPLPQLPAGCPPLGFDGYCLVTVKKLQKWTPGSADYGAIHRGRTYLFVGPQERDQFLADPDAYSPVFAGYDPVLLLDKRQCVPGGRLGYWLEGKLYLFSSQETYAKFGASPESARSYAAGVRQAMSRIEGAGAGTISR